MLSKLFFQKNAAAIMITSALCALILLPGGVFSQSQITNNLNTAVNQTELSKHTDVRAIVTDIVQWLLTFLGMLTVLVIMYGGFKWMTAGGDSKKVDDAKGVIKNGIIGLIIILCSYFIFMLVVTNILPLFGIPSGPQG